MKADERMVETKLDLSNPRIAHVVEVMGLDPVPETMYLSEALMAFYARIRKIDLGDCVAIDHPGPIYYIRSAAGPWRWFAACHRNQPGKWRDVTDHRLEALLNSRELH